ncbi:hypothetical protein J3R30DRAFT_3289703, partial [Lentinula aciculospora]
YAKFIPKEPIQCSCGARTQNRDYIIQSCKISNNYQDLLWDISDDPKMNKILGTKEGIEVLAKFI